MLEEYLNKAKQIGGKVLDFTAKRPIQALGVFTAVSLIGAGIVSYNLIEEHKQRQEILEQERKENERKVNINRLSESITENIKKIYGERLSKTYTEEEMPIIISKTFFTHLGTPIDIVNKYYNFHYDFSPNIKDKLNEEGLLKKIEEAGDNVIIYEPGNMIIIEKKNANKLYIGMTEERLEKTYLSFEKWAESNKKDEGELRNSGKEQQ